MFPHPEYDLPIFGADLVSLPGLHLICIDLQVANHSWIHIFLLQLYTYVLVYISSDTADITKELC
jgi:Ferredoxin-dependent bilin reductase